MEGFDNKDKEEIFSKSVRAGKRTYFFDVKNTKTNDYYLTITESKKQFTDDGKFTFIKHKIFVYKEDFDKFIEGLNEGMNFIRKEQPFTQESFAERRANNADKGIQNSSTDISFEDLDK
ncbi:MAG: DUF3276 family protein [Bacteroidetes bacterium]|nr:DUF3276 family protein [Bacteroidota bacterium]